MRTRWRRTVLAGLPLMVLAGCAGGGSSSRPAPSEGVISLAEARQVLQHYGTVKAAANRTWDARMLGTVEDDPSLMVDAALYRVDRFLGEHRSQPAGYTASTFVIPVAGATGARWFLVEARPSTTRVPRLLAFAQSTARAPWRQTLTVDLDTGRRPPKAATDPSGHALILPEQDARGLVLAPAAAAELHSRYIETGPRSPVRTRFAQAGDTIKVWQTLETNRKQLVSPGITVSYWTSVVPGSIHAVRAADGGAIVVYAVQRQLRATVDNHRWWISIGGGWRPLTGGRTKARDRYAIAWVDQWAAYIPPATQTGNAARITVLGCTGHGDPIAISAQ